MGERKYNFTIFGIISRFFNSLVVGFEAEADRQTFVDEYPKKVFLEEFLQCPIWHDLRKYMESGEFRWPFIGVPLGECFGYSQITAETPYNETFRSLSITYTCRPAFRRPGIVSFSQVPTFQHKIDELRILIQVIGNSQNFCLVSINGNVLRGAKFLAQLAREFRASLSCDPEEFPIMGPLRRVTFTKPKGGVDTKTNPFRALGSFICNRGP